jgi:hypothetical protein
MNDPDASTATKPTEVRLCMCCLEPICADLLRDLPNQQHCVACSLRAGRGERMPWKRRITVHHVLENP